MAFKIEEKRRSQRIKINTPLCYQIRGTALYKNALCDNISAGGMSVISNDFIPLSATLMLEMNILSRTLRPIGKIARVEFLPRSNQKRLGVQFVEFAASEKNYLSDYIKLQMGQL